MPLPSLHPLPNNPTTGQQPFASLSRGVGGAPPASAAGGGGVHRETLKGLQDVMWSDDEDDPDCILCAEPLDLSDLNFKPCQCGMQICQFCYNKLLGTDPRCPGCRRPYDAKAVVFQPVDWEEVKRAKEKKTRRAKTIKQLESVGRRHLLGVRVVMKNTVYVVGMKLPAPGDEAIPILRSNEYFGQYGKISRLYLRDRTSISSSSVQTLTPDNPSTSTGIYIVYVRREDAARAISALDGFPAPQGPPGTVLRATYGTTRYCEAFLRGAKCDNSNCQNLHEWGGESDCFTKEDMETALLRPQEYDARLRQTQIVAAPSLTIKAAWPKPSGEEPIGSTGLPSSANWGKNIGAGRTPARGSTPAARTIKSALIPLNIKNNAAFPLPTPSPIPITLAKEKRKTATAMSRGKSSDSAQSGTTSSAQASPKKKSSTLPNVVATASASADSGPVGPPPGLSTATGSAGEPSRPRQPPTPAQSNGEALAESTSAESEAGPSTASPAPQTPARLNDLPPPLTSEPIILHSPYEEPRIAYFPASDPGFAFVLDIDESELARHRAAAGGYQPSPFSKTLLGLAELGVLAPEIPQLSSQPPGLHGFSGSFQPFDATLDADQLNGGDGDRDGDAVSDDREEEGLDGPRTTSRFEFARQGSMSRGQSPFAVRRSGEDPAGARSGWIGAMPGQGGQILGDGSGMSAAQLGSFVGSYDSPTNEPSWPAESSYGASPSFSRHMQMQGQGQGQGQGQSQGQGQGQGQMRDEREGRMFGFSGKGRVVDQDDFDPNPLQYAQHNPSRGRGVFPDDDRPHHSHSPSNLYNPNGPQQQQLGTPTRPGPGPGPGHGPGLAGLGPGGPGGPGPFPDARTLQQYHQLRTGSPTPAGWRRY